MRILFTLMLGGSVFLAGSASAQSHQKTEAKTKAEVKQTSTDRLDANANKSYTKEALRVREAEQKRNTDLNAEIERVNQDIERVERHLSSKSTDPNYNPAASKARLEQLRSKKEELKKETL